MQHDDMTGVLMQRISRIPLSYRRKAKTPHERGFSLYSDCRFLSLPSGAALPSMKGLSDFLARFQYQKGGIALFVNPHESTYEQPGKLLL